ncbi:MAG: ARMT1-like domain-containing protein [Candidatus Nezhaarchaeota archaeon]|nr:ARMT1-like domain-containing protein [Candidatus Nezhaarchaeota archaeon]MCX8142395.1 ARMT1-like domain-containing protein [Candidatus Nezhaarchaeota archaeon]MDW8050632.1 ARMT1-like domain-containing protein [Nitrososphaerota archaeon]
MKLKPECVPCILNVRRRELEMLELGEEESLRVMIEIARLLGLHASPEINVTKLASIVYRKLKELTVEDPYLYVREFALSRCKEVESLCRDMLRNLEGYGRFKLAVKLSLIGNSFDYGVSGFEPPKLESIPELIRTMVIEIDDTLQLYETLKASYSVYLLDNIEELPFDMALISEMRRLGCRVTAIAKSGYFQNDVTIHDAEQVGLRMIVDKLIESGTDGSSIFLDEVSSEVKRELTSCNVIIAKGMAHYEYLSEVPLRSKTFFLLRAKCRPIAQELKVSNGSYVVLRGSRISF